MRIAVCDDDEMSRKIITVMLQEYIKQNPQYDILVSEFEHADDLLDTVKKSGGFDIYLLDIIMPHVNGIELGVVLRGEDYSGKIIYLTSSNEYVFDSFKVQPFNYIMKPIDGNKLFQVLDSAINALNYKKEKSILVKTPEGTMKLTLESIMYAELVSRILIYHLTNGRTVESTTLRVSFSEATKELIEDEHFAVCGASLVTNLLHVTAAKGDEVVFRGGSSRHISRKLLSELRTKWQEYWQDKK